MRQTTFIDAAVVLLTVGLAGMVTTGCEDPEITQPESLQAPVAMDVADGEVCLPDIVRETATIGVGPLPACDDGGNGFGLVANQRSDRVGVVTLGQERARMANLDTRRPGISQIPVGSRPVDVATSGDGTAAVVANQADRSVTGIDLWTLQPFEEAIEVPGTPKGIDAFSDDDGWVTAVLTTGPDRIELVGGLDCEEPGGVDDRRDHDPSDNCTWREDDDLEGIDLPGRPVDMDVDRQARRAWVVYRNRGELSWYALDDEGLGGDECMIDGASPPCEIDRVGWEGEDNVDGSDTWGATAVDVDPLGLFVYVLDRPGNQLFVFDRQRRELIDAAASVEPPLTPLETAPGIPLVRSSTAVSADVDRQILGDGHVLYRLGARVAANNGRLYEVGATDIECVFDGGEPMGNEAFLFDDEARADSDESNCLVLPDFPLGGDPDFDDDEDLLDHRIVDGLDEASLAVTPEFGIRDAEGRDSEFVGTARCDQPTEFLDAMSDVEDGEGLGCGTPLSPQPVDPAVDDDLDDYEDVDPGALIAFAWALFDIDEELAAAIERSVYDLRVTSETWNVTYEGALPEVGQRQRGLVASDEDGMILSGGLNYCGAGVEVGDRLTIADDPASDDDCDVFDGGPEARTWEIVDVRPFELDLAVIDDDEDRAGELPVRDCFPQGLDYEVRPVDEWTVAGDESGLISPWEADGGECVLREGADEEGSRYQSRVETGEEFLGPYLRFRLRSGEVEPVRGLAYSFDVRRNFSRASRTIIPEQNGATLPAQVLLTPDLGAGRRITVADTGGNRIFVRNLTFPDAPRQFVR